jgi:D-tyrosyl-tRNA(Tyr) deacylase
MSPLIVEELVEEARSGMRRLQPGEEAAAAGAVLVDIRPHADRAVEGEIPGALAVERNVLEWRFAPACAWRLPQAGADLQVVVVCNEGYTSSLAAYALRRVGVTGRPTWWAATGRGGRPGCRPDRAAPPPSPSRALPCRPVRAVVQRVSSASVTVAGEVVGEIGAGLVVLVGVTHSDDAATAAALARKVHELRILDGERSASEVGAPLLVVSQFTLYADTRKGRRPSWSAAAPGPVAEPLVDAVVAALRERGAPVQTGVFGAYMHVALVNEGPVTIVVEV